MRYSIQIIVSLSVVLLATSLLANNEIGINFVIFSSKNSSSSLTTSTLTDIKANDSTESVVIPPGDNLKVSISLEPGKYLDENADWWIALKSPFGWYYFDPHTFSWQRGLAVSYQGNLFEMPSYVVFEGNILPEGAYIFYFGIDTAMNGSLDYDQLIFDSIAILISSCSIGTDTDGDRLDDCYETNTGVYVSPLDTGTDPDNPDTDIDGIYDGDEALGTLMGLNLPGMGANPLRKDIFMEYDWFEDNAEPGVCGPHSHRPTEAALNMVTNAFAQSPVLNPDGTTGIIIHHDYGQGGLFTGGNKVQDLNGVIDGGVSGYEYLFHKKVNFSPEREGYFHYVLMPHQYNTNSNSSGQAELPGDDMVVSLLCYGSDLNVAHTIMHELGHNLNLNHGGDVECNYKPNYNSIMNYKYQFPGIDNDCTPTGNGVLDYSIGDRIDIDELSLDENLGTCGTIPWDWDGDVIIETSVSVDINGDIDWREQYYFCGGQYSTLKDYDDWANINLTGIIDAFSRLRVKKEIITCDNWPSKALLFR